MTTDPCHEMIVVDSWVVDVVVAAVVFAPVDICRSNKQVSKSVSKNTKAKQRDRRASN